jgi:hypothetical protein
MNAFGSYGNIMSCFKDDKKKVAFLTFSEAEYAQKACQRGPTDKFIRKLVI